MYLLHISYDINLAPDLDSEILGCLGEFAFDLDCSRNSSTRDIVLYFESYEDFFMAQETLIHKGSEPLGEIKKPYCLLDLIDINIDKFPEPVDASAQIRTRISEIYEKLNKNVRDNQE